MLIDKFNQFSNAQAVTASGATISEVVFDANHTSNVLKDLGTGEEVYLRVQLDEAFTGSLTTVTFALVSDSTENLATSVTTHWTSGAIAKASLTIGAVVATIAIPRSLVYERYLGMIYTTDNTASTGKVTAFLTGDAPSWKAYTTSHVTKTGR